jgi:hypothetical protein
MSPSIEASKWTPYRPGHTTVEAEVPWEPGERAAAVAMTAFLLLTDEAGDTAEAEARIKVEEEAVGEAKAKAEGVEGL